MSALSRQVLTVDAGPASPELRLAELISFELQTNSAIDVLIKFLVIITKIARNALTEYNDILSLLEDVARGINYLEVTDSDETLRIRDQVNLCYDKSRRRVRASRNALEDSSFILDRVVWEPELSKEIKSMLRHTDDLIARHGGQWFLWKLEACFNGEAES